MSSHVILCELGIAIPVALCTFDKTTGWRVRGVSKSRYPHPRVIRIGSLTLLQVPILRRSCVTPGSFTNPKKILGLSR